MKLKIRGNKIGAIIGTFLVIGAIGIMPRASQAEEIKIKLDNTWIKPTVEPIKVQGTTLVPLRVIGEELGCKVAFDNRFKRVTIHKESKEIMLQIGNKTAIVDEKEYELGYPSKIIKNTTMVPLRFISEQLGCKVDWNEENQLITITSKKVQVQRPVATLVIENYGEVEIELYPELAPNTVNNFISLANQGFYDKLSFHRVIQGFMIQGGDPEGTGMGGPGYSIKGEFKNNGFTQNTLSHTKGVISMARAYDYNSAGSQFFIMSADGTYLDGDYAAFGKVISGLNFIEAIEKVQTSREDKPLEPIVIQKLRVDTKKVEYKEPVVIK